MQRKSYGRDGLDGRDGEDGAGGEDKLDGPSLADIFVLSVWLSSAIRWACV